MSLRERLHQRVQLLDLVRVLVRDLEEATPGERERHRVRVERDGVQVEQHLVEPAAGPRRELREAPRAQARQPALQHPVSGVETEERERLVSREVVELLLGRRGLEERPVEVRREVGPALCAVALVVRA